MAEQAINVIYLLASQPDVLCGDIVKEKTRAVFNKKERGSGTDTSEEMVDGQSSSTSFRGLSSVRSLSQLLVIVGHVASKPP